MQLELLGGLTFARPGWLFLLLPCIALCWLLYRRVNRHSPWDRLLPAAMRKALLQRQPGNGHAGRFVLLGGAWGLAVIALSGPVWETESTVIRQNQSALIVVLDVSHNMLANDLTPNRLERARLKIRDLLQMRSDSQVALLAFAGSAHRVTPLTTDQSTLINLLDGLSPGIMPVSGSDLRSALALAEEMAALLPPRSTQILLITGSVDDTQLKALNDAAIQLGRQLSILGVGTIEGAPVALPEGGFMRDDEGRILLPRLDSPALAAIARRTGASYHDITRDDSDLLSLLRPLTLVSQRDSEQPLARSDHGHWLLLLLLPLAALGARRGWLGLVLCAFLLPAPADANPSWKDLWQRPDQQAIELLAQDQPAAAAERFEDLQWTAWALYQAGDYSAAAAAYERLLQQYPDNPRHHFNHGTALAMSGELEDALEAYEQTLTRAPEHAAARHNRSRIEALLEEQAQQAAEQEKENAPDQSNNEEDSAAGSETGEVATESLPAPAEQSRAESRGADAGPPPTTAGPLPDAEGINPNVGQRPDPASGSASGGASAVTEDTEPSVPAPTEESDMAQGQAQPASELSDAPGEALEPEQHAALQQWLRGIPDNPAELLRRKFLYQRLQQLEERSR